ncbi:MAG: GNAT family acetyltransferase [FCB group bacterium]|nr:GNAT family acetyltransferase [FCB group bacterium]MBL7029074.1 GNAT family acetyltransferase [Candidatus Neomarinimicrobiota bacterium]MBL7122554.1 GNAT family acetyltransferase [Candidatus Neomarinimicrobiota bacterium]
MQIRSYRQSDESSVITLWDKCDLIRSWNNPKKDIHRKLKVQPELFLVGVLDGDLIASAMAGYDGHRGWINYLAVSPDHRQKGFGRKIMLEVERQLEIAGCPKLNLQIRESNIQAVKFYKRLGYKLDEVLSLGKRLDSDE